MNNWTITKRMKAKTTSGVAKETNVTPVVSTVKEDTMVLKRKKTDFTIEPSPLMRISTEVVDPNQENLEKTGLWEFVCKKQSLADPDKVLAYLLDSCQGTYEEFKIEGKMVTFDVNTIARVCMLPTTGPTLLNVETLIKQQLAQVFEKPAGAQVEEGFTINRAKSAWREWLCFVNQRLLMAPEGVEVIKKGGLAATYGSWIKQKINWSKIMYNQIRQEIAGKTTRNKLFFHNPTYLSTFCPNSIGRKIQGAPLRREIHHVETSAGILARHRKSAKFELDEGLEAPENKSPEFP